MIPSEIQTFFNTINEPAKRTSDNMYASGNFILHTQQLIRTCNFFITDKIEPERLQVVKKAIDNLILEYQIERRFDSFWINIPLHSKINFFELVPSSFELGRDGKSDLVYDKVIKLWFWISSAKCEIKSFVITAEVLVIDDIAKKILLIVKEDAPSKEWVLPGRNFRNLDEIPCYSVLRSAQEQGGFKLLSNATDLNPELVMEIQGPQKIIQTWAYRIDDVSKKILNPPHQIQAEWVDFDLVLKRQDPFQGIPIDQMIKLTLKNVLDHKVLPRAYYTEPVSAFTMELKE